MLSIQNPKSKIQNRSGAFTLLELLAAVALLVVLGTMLFQIFGKSSEVVRASNARQEIFQYARAAMEFLERELTGAFTGVDADVNNGIKGMRIYNADSMGPSCDRRESSQGIFFSTGVMARDTRQTVGGAPNPFFGHDVNVARIAYYLNNETQKLQNAAIYRAEMYDLTLAQSEQGGPFVRNCLLFNIQVMSRFGDEQPTLFQAGDWNSDANKTTGGFTRRRGLPQALFLTMRITDESHAMLYTWGAMGGSNKWYISGPDPSKDYWGEEDPVVQTFQQIIYFGRRSD